MYHGNKNNSGEERSSESQLSDIERSISLCTLCEEETKLPSQTSSIFRASLPLIEQSTDYSSCESPSPNFANDSKALHCVAKHCDETQPINIPTYCQQQVFPTFDLTGENCPSSRYLTTPRIQDDNVPKSFFQLLQKSTKNPEKCRSDDSREKTKQSLAQEPKQLYLIENNNVSPKSNIFFKRDAGIEKFELSSEGAQIFRTVDHNNDSPNDYATETFTEETDVNRYEEKSYYRDKKIGNTNSDGIYFSGISDDKKVNEKALTLEDDLPGTSSAVIPPPQLTIGEEIYSKAVPLPQRHDDGEKNVDINGNKHSEDHDEEINVEAPRIYVSGIPDDEIPRKKAKLMEEDELLPDRLSIMESSILPTDKLFQRKRILVSETTTRYDIEEAKEIPRKRPKIVDIEVPNEPIKFYHKNVKNWQELSTVEIMQVKEIREEETAPEKIIPNLQNIESEESESSKGTNEYSPNNSSEIPIASKLTMISEFQVPRQFDVNDTGLASSSGNCLILQSTEEINTCQKSAEEIERLQVQRFEIEAAELASSENCAVLTNTEERRGENIKPSEERHVDIQFTTELGTSKNSVILHNTEKVAVAEEIERSELAQLNNDVRNELADIQNEPNRRDKKLRTVPEEKKRLKEKKERKESCKPEVCGKITPQRTRRSSLDSWNEIENAFASSSKKKSVPCKKNKLQPLTAIPPPDLKRLQNKITKQRQSMTNTLKNLRNLSCYMDRVRETIFAEDESGTEPLYRTVSNINGATVGPGSKIMVSTETQTMMENSQVETSTTMALDVATQTEDTATISVIKTPADTREKGKQEVKNATQHCNPLAEKPPKPRKTRKLLDVDRATARAHEAIFNATFEEFRSKKRI